MFVYYAVLHGVKQGAGSTFKEARCGKAVSSQLRLIIHKEEQLTIKGRFDRSSSSPYTEICKDEQLATLDFLKYANVSSCHAEQMEN